MSRAAAIVFALATACSSVAAPRFDLPEDPAAEIIVLEREGGLAARGEQRPPLLRLQADGTLHTRGGTAQIAPDRIQDLLGYIVDDQRFFEIDSEALRLAVHQSNSRYGSAVVIMDAPTTRVDVRLRARSHSVSQYALAFTAQRHSEIDELRRLAAIEKRLIRFVAVTHLGGVEAAESMLALANNRLYLDHPTVAPLTLDSLATAGTRRDGARVAHFRRAASATSVTIATVTMPEGGGAVVQVRSNEAPVE
ncbi:MAG: hypothetical protein ACYTGZ_11355 [Planctomycetota bacterium]